MCHLRHFAAPETLNFFAISDEPTYGISIQIAETPPQTDAAAIGMVVDVKEVVGPPLISLYRGGGQSALVRRRRRAD
jgi:hypothetical protein